MGEFTDANLTSVSPFPHCTLHRHKLIFKSQLSDKKHLNHFLRIGGSRSSLQETAEDQSSLPSSPRRLNKSFKEKDLRATAVTKGN